jgi:hypothetical protein
MCSNASRSWPPPRPEDELAARLAAAIDELAAAAGGTVNTDKDRIAPECADRGTTEQGTAEQGTTDQGTTDQGATGQDTVNLDRAGPDLAGRDLAEHDLAERDLAERLARAWAMITAADPEVAARTAHYSRP